MSASFFVGGKCSNAKGSSPVVFAYSAFSSARKSGLVKVMRSVISLLPASSFAKGSDVWWRTADLGKSVLLEPAEVASEGERRVESWLKTLSMGVYGASLSGRLVVDSASSSSSRASNRDGISSWRNVLQGAVLWARDSEGRLKGRSSVSSMDGKPNSMASSKF